MFRIEDFIVLSLVVFTLTVLFKDTEGPFHIFEKARNFLVGSEGHERKFFVELLACPWCVGTWMSLLVTLLYWLVSKCTFPIFLAYCIAAIGVTGLLYAMLYSFVSDGGEK